MALATEKNLLVTKDNLKKAFESLDIDKNGSLSIAELEQAFGTSGHKKTKKFWMEFIKEIDEDGSGEVEFEEFFEGMKKLAGKWLLIININGSLQLLGLLIYPLLFVFCGLAIRIQLH